MNFYWLRATKCLQVACSLPLNVTGPAKIGHVGSQNLTTFQTFVTHNSLLHYGMATQFLEIVNNLTGFSTHLTEPKYYISVLRYISSNHMVHFSPHTLFSQARSQMVKISSGIHKTICFQPMCILDYPCFYIQINAANKALCTRTKNMWQSIMTCKWHALYYIEILYFEQNMQ